MRHHNSLLEYFLGPKQALLVADNVINTPIYCPPYINLPQFSQWKCQTLFFDESSGHAWRIWSRDETNETQEMVFHYLRCSYQGHHSITTRAFGRLKDQRSFLEGPTKQTIG